MLTGERTTSPSPSPGGLPTTSCFCGCDRRASFAAHRTNNRGRVCADRLAALQEIVGEDAPQYLVSFLDEGRDWVRILADLVHADFDPRRVDVSRADTWSRIAALATRRLERQLGAQSRVHGGSLRDELTLLIAE
jgi:hypothetical protein